MAACLLQLDGQIGQFAGVGGVVADHVLHQSQQLVHGGVLALGTAAAAVAAAVMGMAVGVAVVVQVIVGVGMHMVMAVCMAVLVGMGVAVMGVLMGMSVGMLMIVAAAAEMIFVNMHGKFSFNQ